MTTLSMDQCQTIIALIEDVGEGKASKALGVAPMTMLRAALGLKMRANSYKKLVAALGGLQMTSKVSEGVEPESLTETLTGPPEDEETGLMISVEDLDRIRQEREKDVRYREVVKGSWNYVAPGWKEMASAADGLDVAMALLRLKWGCSSTDVRRSFARVSAPHHPDRGGNGAVFKRLNDAKQLVLKYLEGLVPL